MRTRCGSIHPQGQGFRLGGPMRMKCGFIKPQGQGLKLEGPMSKGCGSTYLQGRASEVSTSTSSPKLHCPFHISPKGSRDTVSWYDCY